MVTACRDCNLGKAANELPRRWWRAAEHAQAGAAIEKAIERFGHAVEIDDAWQIIQYCSDPSVGSALFQTILSANHIDRLRESFEFFADLDESGPIQ